MAGCCLTKKGTKEMQVQGHRILKHDEVRKWILFTGLRLSVLNMKC